MKPLTLPRFHMIAALTAADARNIWREPMYLLTLLAAPLLGLFVRFALPPLFELIEGQLNLPLAGYIPLAVVFLGLLPSMMAGFLVGFLLLDERDSGLTEYLAVTPLRLGGYTVYRMLLPVLLGFAGTLVFIACVLPVLSLGWHGAVHLLPAVVSVSFQGPWFALMLTAFSSNKVEGIAMGKLFGLFLLAPLAEALLPLPYRWAAAALPQYWFARSFISGLEAAPGAALPAAAVTLLLFALSSIPLFRRLTDRSAAM